MTVCRCKFVFLLTVVRGIAAVQQAIYHDFIRIIHNCVAPFLDDHSYSFGKKHRLNIVLTISVLDVAVLSGLNSVHYE